MNWHTLPLQELEKNLRTDFRSGLSEKEAGERLRDGGFNELPPGRRESGLVIFIRQFQSPLIYILFLAGVVVLWIGETADAGLVFVVLLFNALIGAYQEGKAENTLAALRKFTETTATVLREGKEVIIPDKQVAMGDIVLLREGEKVPADARLIESNVLRVDEAALTGESKPSQKEASAIHREEVPLPEQKNMVFKGTAVLKGNAKAAVVATGLNSYIGRISSQISKIDTEIPLKKDIRYLSKFLVLAIGVFSTLLFGLGLARGRSVMEMFSVAVSLAISIIPEGLPVVLTLILASGVWRMAKRNALVKKLQAVEALGQAKIIAVDKTGTLTRNELVLRKVFLGGREFDIGGDGYEPKGEIRLNGQLTAPANHPELLLAGKIAILCADARTAYFEDTKIWRVSGDPTEAAMFVFGTKLGYDKDDMEQEMPLVAEIPFDYKLKYHATSHKISDKKQFITVVGAPESVLPLAAKIYADGREENMTRAKLEEMENTFHRLARAGLRVVAVGHKESQLTENEEDIETKGLTFLGFFGIQDALRPEVPEAMARAKAAGIKVVMLTGDARPTAVAIAKEAGIWKEGDGVLTDEELEKFSGDALRDKLAATTVFARITPEHKMRIIQAYKQRGEIVAMTGDGVNDAPSLVAADLGVAMGKIGTEVAKEAADIVLLDDNFGSIVSAIEEGRRMYKTIQKTLLFLFSTGLGEVLAIGGSLLANLPLPLLAAQILWMNLVTDSFVAIALAMDAQEKPLSNHWTRPNRFLVSPLMLQRMFLMSLPIGLAGIYAFGAYEAVSPEKAWTMTLTVLAISQWLNGWNCRSETESLFSTNPFANQYLVGGVIIAAILQALVVYSPVAQHILRLAPLSAAEWGVAILLSLPVVFVEEIRKFFYRRFRPVAA